MTTAIYYDKDGNVTRIEENPNTLLAIARGAKVYIDAEHKAAMLGCYPISELDTRVLEEPLWRLHIKDGHVAINPLAVEPPPPPSYVPVEEGDWNTIVGLIGAPLTHAQKDAILQEIADKVQGV